MFSPERLAKLSPLHRLRKAALLLEGCERELIAAGRVGDANRAALDRSRRIAEVIRALGEAPQSVDAAARDLLSASLDEGALRAMDRLRHALFQAGGQSRADWDLIDPESGLALAERRPLGGLRVYLEDIRSPFNVGSMLRTAEAFGFEEALLSASCADPLHPRAARSAMGAASLMPWRRADIEALETLGPAFALELGGSPLADFSFPEKGVVVVGSEELGVSCEALSRCGLGKVSIPMRGAKASINVGVAFGIIANAWVLSRGP